MCRIVLFLVFLFICVSSNSFSQTPLDVIVDSSANTSNNLVYDTGEVFVVFTIQSENVVYKTVDETETITETEDTSVAPDNLVKDNIIIYPNPVTDILYIKIPEDEIVHNILLYDANGKIIISNKSTDTQIDLSSLPAASYTLKIDSTETRTFKIIKQ